jgi:hypothetical protein
LATSVETNIAANVAPNWMVRTLGVLSVAIAAIWWIVFLWRTISQPLRFDDAYMFYRYAIHMRQGLGMSWNLNGVHTYGETSPFWGFAVVALSYLPMSMSKVLILGSWLSSIGAMGMLAWAVACNAKSRSMSFLWNVLPMVAVPFVVSYIFQANAVTGMETMLATALCALFVGLVLRWAKGNGRPEIAGVAGIVLFLVRPEAALAVVLMPALAFLLLPGTTRNGVAKLLGVFLIGFALDLVICKMYFGSPLPLAFYMKSQHGYEGYHTSWGPISNAIIMLKSCWPYLLCLAMCVRASDLRRTAVCLVPATATFCYLFTVMQIMGYDARYYVPYLALFVVPALLALDRRLFAAATDEKPFRWFRRIGAVAICAAGCFALLLFISAKVIKIHLLIRNADRAMEHREIAYDPVHFQVAATRPLPRHYWFLEMTEMADKLIKPLPKGATIAASEVGYLGGAAPEINVIDLAGLNDPQIALHGFNMDELLARKPDIIWMPHTDYTYQRGLMFTNPGLLEQYDVLVGAFGYGMALRKDSPVRPQIDRQMKIVWHDLYPGIAMKDYLVQSISWSGKKHRITDNDTVDNEAEKDRLDSRAQR